MESPSKFLLFFVLVLVYVTRGRGRPEEAAEAQGNLVDPRILRGLATEERVVIEVSSEVRCFVSNPIFNLPPTFHQMASVAAS